MKENSKLRPVMCVVFLFVIASTMLLEHQTEILGMEKAAPFAVLQTASVACCVYMFYVRLNKALARACVIAAPFLAAAYAYYELSYRVTAYGDLGRPDSMREGYFYAAITAAVCLALGYLCAALICLAYHKHKKDMEQAK